ncbi:ATP-binding cassette domain-containing protein, partial [Ureaplasma parvum]
MQKLMDTFFKKKLKVPRPISDDISVRVKNLYAIYDEKQENELVALNNISYDFKKNKIYFIIGNSGSGKSTLVTHFNGLMISRYGFVQVGDIVSGDHYDLEHQLLGVIDSYDKKIINLLWKNQLDQWTFLVLYSNEVNVQQARILFEANFKQKPVSLKFIKTKNNHELITNPYVREN